MDANCRIEIDDGLDLVMVVGGPGGSRVLMDRDAVAKHAHEVREAFRARQARDGWDIRDYVVGIAHGTLTLDQLMEAADMSKYTGSNKRELVTKIEEMLGPDGSREMAERMFELLGGKYEESEREFVVRCTQAEWDAALEQVLSEEA